MQLSYTRTQMLDMVAKVIDVGKVTFTDKDELIAEHFPKLSWGKQENHKVKTWIPLHHLIKIWPQVNVKPLGWWDKGFNNEMGITKHQQNIYKHPVLVYSSKKCDVWS